MEACFHSHQWWLLHCMCPDKQGLFFLADNKGSGVTRGVIAYCPFSAFVSSYSIKHIQIEANMLPWASVSGTGHRVHLFCDRI